MARIDILLKHPGSMKTWLEKGDGRTFEEWLKSWCDSEEKTLHESSDTISIYRAQGRLEVIGRILGLRDEIKKFLDSKHKPENNDGRK